MKRITIALAVAGALLLVEGVSADMICLFRGEQISGTNKICYYDCQGSTFAITIDGLKLCPLNIRK